MANFLRESKYKNIVVDGYPKEACYEQLRTVTSTISSDSNMLTANSKFFAYIDSSGGGSAVGVLPYSSVGKNHVPITSTAYQQPIIRAHSGTVNDLTFNPFDKNQLLTCSNDGTIRTWNIPGEGLVSDCTECVTQFQHSSGVASMGLSFHPCVDGVLASRGAKEISVFDCYSSQEVFCYDKFAHDIHSFAIAPHSHNIIGITSKDKMLSLIDMRNNEAVKRTELHQGTRGTRLCWLGEHSNMLVTTGHSKSNQDRELFVWDNRNLEKPVNTTRLDSSTGVVMPFYDYDTNLLCLFGKGDATMKVFEYEALIESNTDNDSFSTFKGMHPLVNVIPTGCSNTDITRGAAILPKQCNDLMKCEVIKCLRLYENRIQPISCRVIRNEKTKFHQDLYPPTVCEASPVASSKTNMDWLNSKFQKCNTVELKAPIPVSITPTKSAQEMSSSSNSPISPKVASIRSSIGAGASKFKNVYGTENTKAHIYFNLKPITTGIDGQVIACNEKYWAVPYAAGGGAVYVSRHDSYGKVEPTCHVINGHKSKVLDIAFSPYHSDIMVSGSDDCTANVWKIGTDILTRSYTAEDAVATLMGSRYAIKSVQFHPVIPNTVITTSGDNTMRIYDISNASGNIEPAVTHHISGVDPNNTPNNNLCNISLNYNGTKYVAVTKDKMLHVKDLLDDISGSNVSSSKPIEALGRNARVAWCSNEKSPNGTILVVCANVTGMRQILLFDPLDLSAPICTRAIDNAAGQLYPLYDEDTNLVYIAGKGDTIIRYYEITFLEDSSSANTPLYTNGALINKCNEFQTSKTPIAGICKLPKKCSDVRAVELNRLLKLTTDTMIPITFTVPRSEVLKAYFQDDVYPPTRHYDLESTNHFSFADYLNGDNLSTCYISLKPDGMENYTEHKEMLEETASKHTSMTKKTASVFKQELMKSEEDAKKKDQVFNKLQQMAIQRSVYHPNASGGNGGHGFSCDAAPQHGDTDSENEWDD